MIVLGVDPGTATTGYGVIEYKNNLFEVLDFGLIETSKDGQSGERLISINKNIDRLLKEIKPDVVAIEKLFFARNAKTAMNVGQAIGVINYTVAKAKIKMVEYAPGTIKKIITGSGKADKKMIQRSLRQQLGSKVKSQAHRKTHFDNAADALAVALCFFICNKC